MNVWVHDMAICEAYKAGVALKEIAAMHGISKQRVQQIAKRRGMDAREPAKGRRLQRSER